MCFHFFLFLGFTAKPTKVSIGNKDVVFSVEEGSLIIRKPDTSISQDWAISIQ
jgi:hypothetical protein